MKRRQFIAVAGGTVAWPLAARAQQSDRMRLVGVLMGVTAEDPVTKVRLAAFRDGLANLGWSEGRNVRIEYRWAGADVERLKSAAANLAALAPEVIVSGGTEATMALKGVSQTLPIVFVHVADPVAGGLVQSLARVGGNITGFTAYESSIGGKWLQLLKEIAPRVNHVLVLAGENPTWRMHVPTIESAASSFNVQLTITHVHSGAAIEPAIEAIAGKPNSGMIVLPDNMLGEHREDLVTLAAKHRMPDIYTSQGSVGGLLRYTSDWPDQYRRAATYVDQILKGAKPEELPVQQPIKFQLMINLKRAKALGLTVPASLLARADEVIEESK